MKVLFVWSLVIAGALGLPKNDIRDNYISKSDKYEISNAIDDTRYDIMQKPGNGRPPLSLPLFVYKQVMEMNSDQMRSVSALIKALIKPILTSIEFQVLTEFVDDTLQLFRDDPNIKAMVREGVDSMQSLYQNSDQKLAKHFLTWMVSRYSDEQTARSFSSLMSDISPALESWVFEPVKQYYRSFITPTFKTLSGVLNSFFGEDLSSNEIARSGRWSDVVELYIERLTDMTAQARHIVQETAKFLQMQDNGQ